MASSTDKTGPGRVDVDSVSNTGKGDPDGGYESLESATIWFVDVDASGNDDGTSWTDAFNYLQDALDAVSSGDAIWVAEGTYKPTTSASRNKSFELIDGVAIYGGFDPTIGDDTWAERDYINNVTILSGDIDDDGVLDDDNSYHVVYSEDCNTDTVLDGFTITAGNANSTVGGSHNRSGGGMHNEESSPIVTNCIFTGNNALGGGGMYNHWFSDPAVTNCTFVGNSAFYRGGGMMNHDYADATVKNCLFFQNSLSNPSGGTSGGAMNNVGSAPEVINCTFIGNVAGGGYSGGSGGALWTIFDNPETVVTNCIFWGNWATYSGGEINTAYESAITIGYCDIEGGLDGPKVYDYGDDGITDGGGNIGADPRFINIFDFSDITIAAGTTTTIKVTDASRYTVGGEIEYDNDGTPREVTAVDTGTDTVTFANDALSSSSVMGKVIFDWGIGATDVDEDLHLDWDSTCINVGDPNGDYDGQTDIDGQPRVICVIVDIGADEVDVPAVSHWKFDEGSGSTAYDSEDDNDGTIYGATWTTGILDDALSFDGWLDYVTVPHDASLNITGDITISAWIYVTQGGLNQGIVTKCVGNGAQNNPYDFRTQTSAQPLLTLVRADASGHERVYSTVHIPLDEWHHALVRVENKVPDFYVDGDITGKWADTTFTKTPTGNTKPTLIGRRDDALYFNGVIDDVRIYDWALSAEEAEELYLSAQ